MIATTAVTNDRSPSVAAQKKRWLAGTVGAALLTASFSVGATRIDGLNPLQPVSGSATVAVSEGTLHVRLSENERLAVTPWPAYLPQPSGRMDVASSRYLHPAGPTDRLELQRTSASSPWLVVVTGARTSDRVAGNWTLERNNEAWTIRNGKQQRMLVTRTGKTRVVRGRVNGERWCFYVLGMEGGARSNGMVAHETEPQLSIATVKTDTGRCSPQR